MLLDARRARASCRAAFRTFATPAAALAVLLALGPIAAAAAPAPAVLTNDDFQRIARQAVDSTQARGVVTELRAYLAGKPDSALKPIATVMILQALVTLKAPAAELLPAVDNAEKAIPSDVDTQVGFYTSLARVLAERGIAMDRALAYAQKGVDLTPKTEEARAMLAMTRSTLGDVQMRAGRYEAAARSLEKAVPDTPDSEAVLSMLGQAYEKSGKTAAAINAYMRSAAVFPAIDTSANAPLRALWKKQNGSLAGLDARLKTARAASLKHVALDAHALKTPHPAPAWRLPDLDEKVHDMASYKGKVVVLDFWGSWCGPCKMELPLYEAAYQRYKTHPNVAFVSINWERTEDASVHRSTAREFVKRFNYTFPVMYDHERSAVTAFQIQGFPTLFLIDRAGVVRYVNVGYDPHVDQILDAQIQSLLE